MEKRCITAPNAPPAVGPYSHAVAAGNLLFVSGQGPFAPDGSGVRRGTFDEEARITLSNLKAVLHDAGSGLEHVVRVMVYLTNMENFAVFNGIYKEFFPSNFPARSCIQAARLPLDIQVEVDAIALLPAARNTAR
jgi:2-iminobutanoate/2-iminopropanoate deaminase